MLTDYYQLIKPGIVYGNVITVLAAFLFASRWEFSAALFFATMIGMAFVVASACVFNNYFDRGIDSKMMRTKKRALAMGIISPCAALVYASALGIVGSVLLWFAVNPLTALVALLGWLIYVCAYTPLKPISPRALYVGAVAGAMPIVAGYTAVTDKLDLTVFLLFAFMFLWQLPHFIAIAMYRYDEYAAAGIPLVVGKPTGKQKRIARLVFFFSLAVLLIFCVALSLLGLL